MWASWCSKQICLYCGIPYVYPFSSWLLTSHPAPSAHGQVFSRGWLILSNPCIRIGDLEEASNSWLWISPAHLSNRTLFLEVCMALAGAICSCSQDRVPVVLISDPSPEKMTCLCHFLVPEITRFRHLGTNIQKTWGLQLPPASRWTWHTASGSSLDTEELWLRSWIIYLWKAGVQSASF